MYPKHCSRIKMFIYILYNPNQTNRLHEHSQGCQIRVSKRSQWTFKTRPKASQWLFTAKMPITSEQKPSIYNTLGLERRVDVVDYVDYVITSICRKCVDASHCLHFEMKAASAPTGWYKCYTKQTERDQKCGNTLSRDQIKHILCKTEMAYHSSATPVYDHLKRRKPGALRPQNDETSA